MEHHTALLIAEIAAYLLIKSAPENLYASAFE
ncbi:MAG: hypothetical protein ACJAVS_000945 [Paracoccaceae bacterium]|jgi:hypothetical protein